MEIDITDFVHNADAFEFSASRAERGDNAGPETWANAVREAKNRTLLAADQLPEFRSYVKSFGAWSDEEIARWSPAECNALLIQMISSGMRESGLDACGADEFDWAAYESKAETGLVTGNIYRADIGECAGRLFYSLSN